MSSTYVPAYLVPVLARTLCQEWVLCRLQVAMSPFPSLDLYLASKAASEYLSSTRRGSYRDRYLGIRETVTSSASSTINRF